MSDEIQNRTWIIILVNFSWTEHPAGWSPVKIDDNTKTVSVGHGFTAELPCVGSGYPLPSYRWSFGGQNLIIDNINYGQNGGNLFIKNAKIMNSGPYTCNVSNEYGSAIATTQLTVTRKY